MPYLRDDWQPTRGDVPDYPDPFPDTSTDEAGDARNPVFLAWLQSQGLPATTLPADLTPEQVTAFQAWAGQHPTANPTPPPAPAPVSAFDAWLKEAGLPLTTQPRDLTPAQQENFRAYSAGSPSVPSPAAAPYPPGFYPTLPGEGYYDPKTRIWTGEAATGTAITVPPPAPAAEGTPPPPATVTRPQTLADYQRVFADLVGGKAPTPDQLVGLEGELGKYGIRVIRNAAGVAGEIQLPDGTIVDVIRGARLGGGESWEWWPKGSQGGAGQAGGQPSLAAPATAEALTTAASAIPATFYEAPEPFNVPTFTPPTFQAPTFQAPPSLDYPNLVAPPPFSYGDFQAPAPFSYPDFTAEAPFSYADFEAPAPFSHPDFNAPAPFDYPTFVAPTGEQVLAEDPGYAFRAKEGARALENAAAAQGILRTGGTLKDLMTYAQGLASQEYGNAYNRRFGEWGSNRANEADIYKTNWANTLTDYVTDRQNAAETYDRNLANRLATYGLGRQNAAETYDRNLANRLTAYGLGRTNAAETYDRNLDTALKDYELGLGNAAQTYDRNWATQTGAWEANRAKSTDVYDRLWREALSDYSTKYGKQSDDYTRALETYKTNLGAASTGYGFGLDVAAGKAGGLQGAQTLQGNLALGSMNANQNANNAYVQNLLSLLDINERNALTYTPYSSGSYTGMG